MLSSTSEIIGWHGSDDTPAAEQLAGFEDVTLPTSCNVPAVLTQ